VPGLCSWHSYSWSPLFGQTSTSAGGGGGPVVVIPHEEPVVQVTVSDPGQPKTETVPLRALVRYTDIDLSVANAEFGQSVFLTVQKGGLLYDAQPDLYLMFANGKSIAWGPFKLNSAGQALLGPIYVYGEKPLRVSVFGKLDTTDTTGAVRVEGDPASIGLHVTGVSIDGSRTVQKTVEFKGRFPILGATHIIDANSQVGTLSFRSSERVVNRSIVKNVPRQILGGFKTIATGEISTRDLTEFWVDGNGADVSMVSNIEIIDENNVTVAGPVDMHSAEKGGGGYFVFTDKLVFPMGEHHYFIIGAVGASFTGTSIAISLPSGELQQAQGQTTGHWFFSSAEAGWGPTMTVRGPSKLKVSVQKTVDSKQVIAGSIRTEVLELAWDATQADGNIAVSFLQGLGFDTGEGFRPSDTRPSDRSDISNVQLYNGGNALNTGGNVWNPTDGKKGLNFDNRLVLPTGTVTVTTLKLDIGITAKGVFVWGLDSGSAKAFDLTTGESVEVEVVSGVGPIIEVVPSGGFWVQPASTSPTTAKKGLAVMFQGNIFYQPSVIAEIEMTANALEGLSGQGGGFIEFSIEASNLSNLGEVIGLVIGDRQVSGVMRRVTEKIGSIMFSLDSLRIPAGQGVTAKLYTAVLPNMLANSTITVSCKQGQMTGVISGVRVAVSGPNVLSTVTVVP